MHIYTIKAGIYVLLIFLIFGCGEDPPTRTVDESPPSASFTISPASGPPGTTFTVDASASFSRAGTTLEFRWDWEDDGKWDTSFSTEGVATHVYDSLGHRSIRLEVKDERGVSRTARGEAFVTVASKEMVLIPAGEFLMGSPEGIGNDDEHPQHKVYLDDFLIGKYEVTNDQYVEFLNAIGRNDDEDGHAFVNMEIAAIRFRNETYKALEKLRDHPVVAVSWYGATAYAKWEGGRLPTEAEWEKAARGTDALKWPCGDLWIAANCNTWEAGPHSTTPVGSYPKGISPYGVHDLTGNVYEWLADWYQADYYKVSPPANPKGPESGAFRVLRGGSWAELNNLCRPSVRFGDPPGGGDSDFGFRIAKDVRN